MFDIAKQFLIQLFEIMPFLIIVTFVFDFLGSFFFNKR